MEPGSDTGKEGPEPPCWSVDLPGQDGLRRRRAELCGASPSFASGPWAPRDTVWEKLSLSEGLETPGRGGTGTQGCWEASPQSSHGWDLSGAGWAR